MLTVANLHKGPKFHWCSVHMQLSSILQYIKYQWIIGIQEDVWEPPKTQRETGGPGQDSHLPFVNQAAKCLPKWFTMSLFIPGCNSQLIMLYLDMRNMQSCCVNLHLQKYTHKSPIQLNIFIHTKCTLQDSGPCLVPNMWPRCRMGPTSSWWSVPGFCLGWWSWDSRPRHNAGSSQHASMFFSKAWTQKNIIRCNSTYSSSQPSCYSKIF